jgi:hypothetical protein
MIETESISGEKIWKKFLRKHWKMLVIFIVAAIVVVAGAILVFLWFTGNAQTTGLIPTTFGLWAMGHVVSFILWMILWEFLLIGIPAIIVLAAIYFLWWKKLPADEKEEYRRGHLFFGKHSKRSDGGNAISFIVFIGLIIKVYIDGKWNTSFATWTFDYLIYSILWIIIGIVIIFGIPVALGGTWWIHREMKKKP